MKAWWTTKAWPWLKKNWWLVLLAPVGVLVVINKVFRPHIKVTSSELTGAADEAHKASAEAARRIETLQAERDARVSQIHEEHEETVKVLTDEQAAKVNDLLEDPEELNSYLLDVGKKVRDGQV